MSLVLPDADLLVPPRFFSAPEYVTTVGPEFVGLGKSFGFTANLEQELILEHGCGFDKRGRMPFEVVVIAGRQNLKTGLLILQGLGKSLLLKRELQVWTAHLDAATDQAFREIKKLAEANDELARRIKRMPEGRGVKEIEFVNGSRIVFRARTGKGGQSMSSDDINLDELFAVEPQHIGSFMPTMSTRPHAQITYCSSAAHAGSDYQRTVTRRGRAGAARMVYAEWTVLQLVGQDPAGVPMYGPPPCELRDCDHSFGSVGCICDDPAMVKLANPSLERSTAPAITWEYIQSEREAMADIVSIYLRERLGVEESAASRERAIHPDLWERRGPAKDEESNDQEPAAPEPVALGVALSLDRAWASIGVYGKGGVLGAQQHDKFGPWVMAETARIAKQRKIPVGIDGNGPASSLIEPLRKLGVTVHELSTDEYCDACDAVYDGLLDTTIRHLGHDDLNAAVQLTGWRKIGDRRVWARISGDITMLEADTAAWFAASKGTTPAFFAAGADLDLCDRCETNPHEDSQGVHDYLCPTCREELAT